jgi:hypothetical protein
LSTNEKCGDSWPPRTHRDAYSAAALAAAASAQRAAHRRRAAAVAPHLHLAVRSRRFDHARTVTDVGDGVVRPDLRHVIAAARADKRIGVRAATRADATAGRSLVTVEV